MQFVMENPIHPGEILKEEFLKEYALTAYRVAESIGVPRTRLERILRGENGITADTALRLARYFGNSPEFWLNLQRTYDLALAAKNAGDLNAIVPVQAA
ncbi:HigA family addiction module antitoxin [Rhizobium sp. 32-5/1]|uniref:HigA family addiction module antitoxin n=1 Tax=Rhizobium sp. 32-5/1 TaxID=3019602 RepID=UPI00240D7741|nr:HigA family addiction module antitoxin [Rhizobium sp. 32-5/1]WEZ83630.1 HigA family addiction module antitoxin [Rhizobium sp. 32-5/1]